MKFCSNCHNMLYIRVQKPESGDDPAEDANPKVFQLIYACRNCGFSEVENPSHLTSSILENTTLHADHVSSSTGLYSRQTFPYIQHDPSFPRVTNIKCPSATCESNRPGHTPEVIYMKVDPENLTYVYFCCHCDAVWQNHRKN